MKKLTILALFALVSPWLVQAVTLEFKGNETLEVREDVAERSGIIKHLLEDLGTDDKALVPLYEVTLKEWDTVAPLLEVNPDQVSAVIGDYTIDQLAALITPLNYLEAEPELEAVLQALEGKLIARYAEHDYAQLTKAIESMCKLGLSAYLQSRINFNVLKTIINTTIPLSIDSNTPGYHHAISGLVVSKDGKKLYSTAYTFNYHSAGTRTAYTGEIKVWNITRQGLTLAQTIEAHRNWMHSLIMNAEGTKLYSGSVDGTIKIWNIKADGNLELEHTIQSAQNTPGNEVVVLSLAISPDGTKLYGSLGNGTIAIWNLTQQGAELAHTLDLYEDNRGRDYPGDDRSICLTIALSPDGRTLFAGTTDGLLITWNVAGNIPVKLDSTDYGSLLPDPRPGDRITSFAFNSNGSRLYAGSHYGDLQIWDIINQRPQYIATQNQHPDPTDVHLAMSPDGKMLYATSLTAKPIPSTSARILSPVISPSGHYYNPYMIISAWKVLKDGQLERSNTFDLSNAGHTKEILALAVGPDGTLYSGSLDGTIKMWELAFLKDLSCRQALLVIKLHQAKENGATYKLCKDEKEHIFNGLPDPLKKLYKDAYELTDKCADTDEGK